MHREKFINGRKDDLISKLAFMFPGQNAQYVSMGKDLYKSSNLFRQILDECIEITKSETGEDLSILLIEATNHKDRDLKMARTELIQPALFVIEYALTKILEQNYIRPDFLIGHGVGEYTAACVSGVFDMRSALKIVIKSGQLIQILESNGLEYTDLNISYASHSKSLDPILSDFGEYVEQFRMKIPEIPFISCLTGKFITPEQAVSGTYWAQQLRSTVQFHNGITLIGKNDDVLFMEVGPNTLLSSFMRENNAVKNKDAIISTLGKPDNINDTYKLITALGKIFNIGLVPEYLKQRGNETLIKISLPTYPFKKERHWIDFEYAKAFGEGTK